MRAAPSSDSTHTESLTLRAHAERVASHVEPSRIGRPPLEADPEIVNIILAAVADGNYRETACRLAGISKQALYNILKRADRGDAAAMAFVDALEKAEAMSEATIVKNVRKASESPQFWAAGMTLLERKSPDRWGRRQDDSSAPRVVVQIGARDSDISVSVSAPRTDDAEVNAIPYYQNQTDSEGQHAQALTATPPPAFAGESRGRKSISAQRKSDPAQGRRGNPRGTHPGRRAAVPVRRAGAGKGRVTGAGAEKGEA